MEMKIFETPFLYIKTYKFLAFFITLHTTLGNELSLKFLLGVCNTEERCYLSTVYLWASRMAGGAAWQPATPAPDCQLPLSGLSTPWAGLAARYALAKKHRLNMELDLSCLFGLLCTAILIG
jgi:hypothetical protein